MQIYRMPWRRFRSIGLAVAATATAALCLHAVAAPPAAKAPGKLRILVDKTMMQRGPDRSAWGMTDEIVGQIAQAGFNVVVPRSFGNDLVRVRRVAERAAKHGILYMPWLRGTLHAYDKTEARHRMVWQNGVSQTMYSPNADRLWEWLGKLVVAHAEISVDVPSLTGVFLDYENYHEKGDRQGSAYGLSYDEKILSEFAAARNLDLPALPPAERYPWLAAHNLHDAFARFQVAQWRERCRRLRQQVDAVNDRFQFCIYPTPRESRFIREAAGPEWSTTTAPLIVADWTTYGRPQGLVLSHRQGLDANRGRLEGNLAARADFGFSHLYISGIDPILKGADPEFCGRNAVMISEISDGYWVFYEGPTYGQPDHAAYMAWFAKANRAIAAQQYGFWREPRETPDPAQAGLHEAATDKIQVAFHSLAPRMYELAGESGKYEIHTFAGNSLTYLSGFKVVVLQNFNAALPADNPFVQALRAYVEQGGGLFLAHDTAWFMESPFPEIAVRAIPRHERQVEAGRHVVETDLEIAAAHAALGGMAPGTRYATEFRDHMIFAPGPEGKVLIRNTLGDAVYVAGKVGRGRVMFSGCYYGHREELQGTERRIFPAVLDWLAGIE